MICESRVWPYKITVDVFEHIHYASKALFYILWPTSLSSISYSPSSHYYWWLWKCSEKEGDFRHKQHHRVCHVFGSSIMVFWLYGSLSVLQHVRRYYHQILSSIMYHGTTILCCYEQGNCYRSIQDHNHCELKNHIFTSCMCILICIYVYQILCGVWDHLSDSGLSANHQSAHPLDEVPEGGASSVRGVPASGSATGSTPLHRRRRELRPG